MTRRTKKYLILGAVAAGGLVLLLVLGRRNTSTATSPVTGVVTSPGTSTGSTAASSAAQTASSLAAFEQSIGTAFSSLGTQVSSENTALLSAIAQLTPTSGSASKGNPTNPARSSSGSGGSSGASGGSGPSSSPTHYPSTQLPGSSGSGTSGSPKTKPSKTALATPAGYSGIKEGISAAVADYRNHDFVAYRNNITGKVGLWHPGMKLPANTTLFAKAPGT